MAGSAWPTTIRPEPHEFLIKPIETVVGPTSPYTGAREVMHRYHQWHVLMTFNHTEYFDYWGLFATLNTSRGGRTIFQVPLFSYQTQRGSKTGSVTLNGAHAAGVTSLAITGGSGTLLRGDWIQILQATDVPRAYVITSSEAGGAIGINPGLRVAHSGGAAIHYLATVPDGFIKETMELADPEFARSMPSPSPGYFQPFAVEFVSALRLSP